MRAVEQLPLLGQETHVPQSVSVDVIAAQKDQVSANRLCFQASGKEDKQVYMALGIDKGQWSRIIDGGSAHFPPNLYQQFMTICGNEIPLIYMALKRGYGLVQLRDAKDRKIAELEAKNAELQKEIETLAKYGVIQRAK